MNYLIVFFFKSKFQRKLRMQMESVSVMFLEAIMALAEEYVI